MQLKGRNRRLDARALSPSRPLSITRARARSLRTHTRNFRVITRREIAEHERAQGFGAGCARRIHVDTCYAYVPRARLRLCFRGSCEKPSTVLLCSCVCMCARACIDVCVRVSVSVCLHTCAVRVSLCTYSGSYFGHVCIFVCV